jgi:DNA-binding NtrC family response regulator
MTPPRRPRLILVDDGLTYARAVAEHLPEFTLVQPQAPHGRDGRLPDGPAALEWLAEHPRAADLVLLDVQFDVPDERLLPLPGQSEVHPKKTRRFQGVAILHALRKRHPDLPVVLLTELEDLSLAEAMADVSAEPLVHFGGAGDLDTLRIRIHQALAEEPLQEEGVLWGRAPVMQTLRRRLVVLARGTMPVVLEGPTGTGKSHLAERFVHRNSGRQGPFVALDLATVPQDLVPAALFGVVRGAYTGSVADRKGAFEAAHGGTLFLDEVQNTSAEVQKQLLRVLQERRIRAVGGVREVAVDVKVVAASNVPLDEAVQRGTFRADLAMRLGPASRVLIPSLSERRADLALFVRRLAEATAERPEVLEMLREVSRGLDLGPSAPLRLVLGPDVRGEPDPAAVELALPQPAWAALRDHGWPGNMRELEAVVANLVVFTLFGAVDALRSGAPLASTRLQIDPGLVHGLLGRDRDTQRVTAFAPALTVDGDGLFRAQIAVEPAATLAAVATGVERQVLRQLWQATQGDWSEMARRLLGDARRGRAVQLRFNQVGLRVRDLARGS